MKAVIFDMDGVIIDSEPIHNRLMLKTFGHFGIPFDERDFVHYVGTTNAYLFREMKQKYEVAASVEEMDSYQYNLLMETIPGEDIEPVAGIPELLVDLKSRGIPAAVASSSSLALIELVTKKFNLQAYFAGYLSGEDLPRSKPDPAIYLLSAEKLGLRPAECLVIEDAALGVEAAKAAGMTCIAYRNPNSGAQDLSKADLVVDSIGEIDLGRFFA